MSEIPAGCASWTLPAQLQLRPILTADQAFLCALYASTRWAELSVVPWSDAQRLNFLGQQFALQHRHYQTHYPDAEFLLILYDEQAVGRIYVYRAAQEIRLMDIALLPEWRGRGLGGALLAQLTAEADRDGRMVSLHVERENPAQRLYARAGFRLHEQGEIYQQLRREPRVGEP